jgi:hypothetical protein
MQASAVQPNERLVFTPYPGDGKWKEITNKSGPDGWMRESIPSEQDVADIKDIITLQAFANLKSSDPANFLEGMMKRSRSACENVRVNGPNKREEKGQDVAYGQVYCGKQRGKDYGVNMFIKVLKGKDALYVVQREFHVPATAVGGVTSFSADQMDKMKAMIKAINETNQYLAEGAFVCGPTDADVRCKQ